MKKIALLFFLFTLCACNMATAVQPQEPTASPVESQEATLPPAEQQEPTSPQAADPSCSGELDFLAAPLEAQWASYQGLIERDVQTNVAFWQAEYGKLGAGSYPGVCHIVEYEAQTAPFLEECGLSPERASGNAFYCSTVNAVMWDGPGFYHPIYTEIGDAAVTFITAHEFGHSAQVLSGTLPSTSVNAELQADCYAGAYLNYMNEQGLMSEGDAQEVIRVVFLLGQSRIGSTWQTRTHGTSIQREVVVRRGFTQGVEGCLNVDFEELIDDINLPSGPRRP